VLDYDAPSSKAAIAAFGLGQTAKNLLKLAACFSKADAEDLLSDAMVSVCDPDGGRPWDPERGSFLAHMRIVIRDLARRQRRSARARREIVDSVMDETMAHPRPPADEALSDARGLERRRRLGGILRERIAHNARTLQVFDRTCEGIEDAGELARLLGCTVADVYAANRQIARHAAQVLAEDEAAEVARMKDVRQAAKKEPVTT